MFAYCLYNSIDKGDRKLEDFILFYFVNDIMQTDLCLKIIQNRISLKMEYSDNLLFCFSYWFFLKKW